MFRKNRCYNGGNKHNFKPTYTEEETTYMVRKASSVHPDYLRSLMIKDVYVGSVCEWCGKVVNKP